MQARNLNELNLEELELLKKSNRTILIILIGVLSLIIGSVIYSIMIRSITYIILLPIMFLPLIFIFYSRIKKVKAEIESRYLC